MKREEVYKAIDTEREYQNIMWKNSDGVGDNPLTVGEHLVLIRAYLRKAEDIWSSEEKPCKETMHIVRKIAGIAVNCGEQHEMPKREI